MELTSRVSGEKEAQICKVGVCACIIGPERGIQQGQVEQMVSGVNTMSPLKKKKTTSQYTYACSRGTGHFEVRKRML